MALGNSIRYAWNPIPESHLLRGDVNRLGEPCGAEWICSHDTGHMWEASSPHLPQHLYIKGNQS